MNNAIDRNVRSLVGGLSKFSGVSMADGQIDQLVELVNNKAGEEIGKWTGMSNKEKNEFLVTQVQSGASAITANLGQFKEFGLDEDKAVAAIGECTEFATALIENTATKEDIEEMTRKLTAGATHALGSLKTMSAEKLQAATTKFMEKVSQPLKDDEDRGAGCDSCNEHHDRNDRRSECGTGRVQRFRKCGPGSSCKWLLRRCCFGSCESARRIQQRWSSLRCGNLPDGSYDF